MPRLLEPLRVGAWQLPHRVIMAPLTRCRAERDGTPTAIMAKYYRQRALPGGASLIISEATNISRQGQGYPNTPGLFQPSHVAGWLPITRAVHGAVHEAVHEDSPESSTTASTKIVAQLWHVGRMSHPDFQPDNGLPVSASALDPGGTCRTYEGVKSRVTPRALDQAEISGIIDTYQAAAQHAKDAGFDGVELHGANGYLPDQFLRDSSNARGDDFGGSIENRARFMLLALEAILKVWPNDRVGIRLSPSGDYHAMRDSNSRATFGYVVERLSEYNLAYAHIMRSLAATQDERTNEVPIAYFRERYKGVLITNGRFDFAEADQFIREGIADAVAFGTLLIANPDLSARFARVARGESVHFNPPNPSTYYGPDAVGYTDYPWLDEHASS